MKNLILIFISLVSLHGFADEVKILSWNVFMLPKPIKFSYQAERTRIISDELNKGEHDIIFLQEAFPGSFHDHLNLITRAKYPYQHYLKRPFFSHTVFGSGLYVLSKYPMTSKKRIYYKDCRVADCFAAKGLSLVTFKLPGGKEVQIGNTHLQAGHNQKASQIRLKQLEQVKKIFRKTNKPGLSQILLGDINIDAKHPDFPVALGILDMKTDPLAGPLNYTNGFPVTCYNKPGDNTKEWIDHILISKTSEAKVLHRKVKTFSAVIDNQDCPLSDHYAIEATLSY